jgi:hypothetical protein
MRNKMRSNGPFGCSKSRNSPELNAGCSRFVPDRINCECVTSALTYKRKKGARFGWDLAPFSTAKH